MPCNFSFVPFLKKHDGELKRTDLMVERTLLEECLMQLTRDHDVQSMPVGQGVGCMKVL